MYSKLHTRDSTSKVHSYIFHLTEFRTWDKQRSTESASPEVRPHYGPKPCPLIVRRVLGTSSPSGDSSEQGFASLLDNKHWISIVGLRDSSRRFGRVYEIKVAELFFRLQNAVVTHTYNQDGPTGRHGSPKLKSKTTNGEFRRRLSMWRVVTLLLPRSGVEDIM